MNFALLVRVYIAARNFQAMAKLSMSSHLCSDVSIVPYKEKNTLDNSLGAWPTIAASLTTPTAYM